MAGFLPCLRHFDPVGYLSPAVNGWANFYRADGAVLRTQTFHAFEMAGFLSCLRHFDPAGYLSPAVNGWANFYRADGAVLGTVKSMALCCLLRTMKFAIPIRYPVATSPAASPSR